jgi:hypothetical protein
MSESVVHNTEIASCNFLDGLLRCLCLVDFMAGRVEFSGIFFDEINIIQGQRQEI